MNVHFVVVFLVLMCCVTLYIFLLYFVFFFFKQKTAYEMRISDWSSDVCSSDLPGRTPIAYTGGNDGYWSFDPYLDRKTESYIGRVEYDAGFATITSISALKKLRIADGRDLEGSSLDVINQLSNERSKQFTQEIRITSDDRKSTRLNSSH